METKNDIYPTFYVFDTAGRLQELPRVHDTSLEFDKPIDDPYIDLDLSKEKDMEFESEMTIKLSLSLMVRLLGVFAGFKWWIMSKFNSLKQQSPL